MTYAYDDAGQLTGADRTGSGNDESYDYDDNGNRETANGASYTTTANNRLSSDGTFNYTYDDEGNTLTKTRISSASVNDKTVEYAWDYRNRLTSVAFKNNAGTITQKVNYTYDAFDRLIGRTHDTDGDSDIDASVNYLFDGQHVALALADNGTVQNRYLHGPMIDMVLADEQAGGDVLWTLADNQGTIRDLATYNSGTNTTTIANHRTFNSFGKITAETNAAVDSLFAYTGRILDETTGDQNNRARWYDSDTGRWLSEDPIKEGFNWGIYAGNSPINGVDPTGEKVYACARDLAGKAFVGTHQFIVVIPDNPKDFKNLVDLGNGQLGFTVGAHNVDGRLKVVFNEPSDLQAYREMNDPKKYPPPGNSDFDCQTELLTAPKKLTDSELIKELFKAILNYRNAEEKNNISYPALGGALTPWSAPNSNSWAQSILEAIGVVSANDFSGADVQNDSRLPLELFKDPKP